MIDPATGKIEHQHPFPTCAEKAAAAGPAPVPAPVQPALALFGDHALGKIDTTDLFMFAITSDGPQEAPAEKMGWAAADPAIIAGSGEAAYATTRESSICAQEHGHDTNWDRFASDGTRAMTLSQSLTLRAADADGTFWATSASALYKLTKQGRRAARLADFPEDGDIVRSEPTRVLVADPLGPVKWTGGGAAPLVKEQPGERRVIAIDKATGDTTELVRGSLGFVRTIGNELWILRDGTELLSIGEGDASAAPRATLPEAATSVEIEGETVYYTPSAGDRVLAMSMTGGAPTPVGDGLAAAVILGASADRLFVSAADLEAQAALDQALAKTAKAMYAWFAWAPPRRLLGIPKAGGAAKTLAGDLQTIQASAADAGHLYVQIAACYEAPDVGGCIVDNPAILVVDKRTSRVRRMSHVGSCEQGFVLGGRCAWFTTGGRFDPRGAAEVFLGGGIPHAAAAAGDDVFVAIDRRVMRTSASGYEVMADLLADALAVGGGYLYFHDAEAARIGRIAIKSGKLETVVASLPSVGAMTADAGGVYWWAASSQALEAAKVPGARRTLLANAPRPDGLAAGGGRVAILAGDHLTLVSEAAGAPRTIPLGSTGFGVAADDTYAYWTAENAGAAVLVRARWSGGEPQILSRAAH